MRTPTIILLLRVVGAVLLPISGLFFVLCLPAGEWTLTLAFGLACAVSVYLIKGAPQLIQALGFLQSQVDAMQAIAEARRRAMRPATPAQSLVVRRRRRTFYVLLIVWGVLWIGPVEFGGPLLGRAVGLWLFGGWFCAAVILIPLSALIWRCPVCERGLGRSAGKFCPHCETRFDV